MRSLRRCTQEFLYLALRSSDADPWRLPEVALTSDETVNSAAERALATTLGTSAETFIVGNAPAAHVEAGDARTFFMLGIVLDGTPALAAGCKATDFAWLTCSELLQAHGERPAELGVLTALLPE